MTLYLQKIDELLAAKGTARHRVAITLCELAKDLTSELERARGSRKRQSLQLGLAEVDNIAAELCLNWYAVDYNDPATYESNEYDTDRLLRLTSTGAAVN